MFDMGNSPMGTYLVKVSNTHTNAANMNAVLVSLLMTSNRCLPTRKDDTV